jgi:Condensation domain/Phosphopantetheine attachment site
MPNTNASPDPRRALLQQYLRRGATVVPMEPPILHSEDQAPAPLSFGQQLIWLHSQCAPELPLYTETWTVHFHGHLNPAALKSVLQEFIRRHEAWRTVIRESDGVPFLAVLPSSDVNLQISDVRSFPEAERESRATELARADVVEPFDLANGPLLRFRLISLADDLHRLYVALHHSVFDGFAVYRVFLPELATLYDAYCNNYAPELPDVSITYSDYARWQFERLHSGELDKHIAYWRRKLSGELPLLNLPTTHPRPATQTFAGDMCPVNICRDLKEKLKEFAGRESCTLFMVLLAAFYAVLYRYTGQEDLLVGTVTAGRNHRQLSELVGFCLNTVPLRVDLSGQPNLAEVVRRVRDATLDALAHDDVPFDVLVRELRMKPDTARHPIFQVMLTLEPPLKQTDPRWDLTQVEVSTKFAKFDLYWELDEREDGISGKLTYSSSLFSPEAAKQIVDDFCATLAIIANDAQSSLSSLPMSIGSPLVGEVQPVAVTAKEPSGASNGEEADGENIALELRQIWQRLLRNAKFDVYDSFFDVGGYSLLAVQMLSTVEQRLGVRIPLPEFITSPTISMLMRSISMREKNRDFDVQSLRGEVLNAIRD